MFQCHVRCKTYILSDTILFTPFHWRKTQLEMQKVDHGSIQHLGVFSLAEKLTLLCTRVWMTRRKEGPVLEKPKESNIGRGLCTERNWLLGLILACTKDRIRNREVLSKLLMRSRCNIRGKLNSGSKSFVFCSKLATINPTIMHLQPTVGLRMETVWKEEWSLGGGLNPEGCGLDIEPYQPATLLPYHSLRNQSIIPSMKNVCEGQIKRSVEIWEVDYTEVLKCALKLSHLSLAVTKELKGDVQW